MVAVADKVQKRFVDASIVGKLGVKRRGHDASLPHGDGIFVIAFSSKNFDAGSDAGNLWSTDEDHLDRSVSEFSLADGAVNLAAVGVAADADIERTESGLLRVFHFGRQQDGSGTGAECRVQVDKQLELFESGFTEEFEERPGFAAGDNEATDFIELLGFFDEHNLSAQFLKPFAMCVEIALQG